MRKMAKKEKAAGFGSLRAAAGRSDQDDLDLPVEQEDDEGAGTVPASHQDAVSQIVRSVVEAATTSQVRRRLTYGQGIATVVIVPAQEWIEPVLKYLRRRFGTRWRVYRGAGKTSASEALEVAHDLSHGFCVLGVAEDKDLLPAVLVEAADIFVSLRTPSAEIIRVAISRFCGRSPGPLPPQTGAGMGLNRLVTAFRPGSGPKSIARRLVDVRTSNATVEERLPDLATAYEFGEARTWAMELAADVAAYRAGTARWDDCHRGVVIESPPGLGKSLLGRLVSRHCGIPIVTTSVANWFAAGPGYLDSVIKQLRAVFAEATALAASSTCCLIHWDELESLPSRIGLNASDQRGKSWWTPIINDALTLLDSSLASRTGIIVMGSTNYADQVDPALLRPGRFERVIRIDPPNAAGALNILRFHLNGDLPEDLDHLGPLLAGRSGADIMLVVRDARRLARHAGRALTSTDLEAAILPPLEVASAKLHRMSVHESAHAVAALAVGSGKIDVVMLRTEGSSGGQTIISNDDEDLVTAATIEDRVVVALAGRAAEATFCNTMSVGAGGSIKSDIGSATMMLASLHGSFGLGGDIVFLGDAGHGLYRELSLNRDLREKVELHLRRLQERAFEVVRANRAAIQAVSQALTARRHLGGEDVAGLVAGKLVRFPRPG